MTADQITLDVNLPVAGEGLDAGAGSGARAYCGELHGRSWSVPTLNPPLVVRFAHGDPTTAYRLVLYPRSDRPARDHRGNYVYVPLNYPFVEGVIELDGPPQATPAHTPRPRKSRPSWPSPPIGA